MLSMKAAIAGALIATHSLAQSHTITMRWEVSLDDGVTWRTGLVPCSAAQRSVRVRLWAEWNRDSVLVIFAVTQFDATVRTPGRVSQDSIDSFNVGIVPWNDANPGGYSVSQHDDVLKIDDWADVQPPGVGPRWVSPFQGPPGTPAAHPEDPTVLFLYRLRLDGVPGERQIQGLFRVRNQQFPDRVAALYIAPFDGTLAFVPTTISNATILVVPCPADFDDGSSMGTPDGGVTIDDLLYYLSIYAEGVLAADLSSPATPGTPDGGVTIDDLLYYLFRFESGC